MSKIHEPSSSEEQAQNPFCEDASNTISSDKSLPGYEKIARINAALKTANTRTSYVRITDQDIVQKTTKDGRFYDAIEIDVVSYTATGEENNYKRTKPMFSKEGQLLASLVPFDPEAQYKVTSVKKRGGDKEYSEWVNLEKVV